MDITQTAHHHVRAVPAGYIAEQHFFHDHLAPRAHLAIGSLDESRLRRSGSGSGIAQVRRPPSSSTPSPCPIGVLSRDPPGLSCSGFVVADQEVRALAGTSLEPRQQLRGEPDVVGEYYDLARRDERRDPVGDLVKPSVVKAVDRIVKTIGADDPPILASAIKSASAKTFCSPSERICERR